MSGVRWFRVLIWAAVAILAVVVWVELMSRPDSGVRRIDFVPGGMNGIGPSGIEVIGGIAYTLNERSCTVSAIDLRSGRVIRCAGFKVPGTGRGYPYSTPIVKCEREALLESDGKWLYLAVPNRLYCIDRTTLNVVSQRKYPSSMWSMGRFRLLARPIRLVWMSARKRLAVQVSYTFEGIYDLGWSTFYHLTPRRLWVTRSVRIGQSLSLPAATSGALRAEGPFALVSAHSRGIASEVLDIGTGRLVCELDRRVFLASGAQSGGNPPRLYAFSNGPSRGRAAICSPVVRVYDVFTGKQVNAARLKSVPGELYPATGAEIIFSPDGKRILLAVKYRGNNKTWLTTLGAGGNQISPWCEIPGVCRLGGAYADWSRDMAYLTDDWNNCIRVVDLDALRETRRIAVGIEVSGLWYDPAHDGIVIQGRMNGHMVWKLDPRTGRLVQLADLSEMRSHAWSYPPGPLVAPDWKHAYALREEWVSAGVPGLPAAGHHKLVVEKREMRTGSLVHSVDAGRIAHPRILRDPTLIPAHLGPRGAGAVDESAGRLYYPRGETVMPDKVRDYRISAIEVWDTKTHVKLRDIALSPVMSGYAPSYIPMLDTARHRLYLPGGNAIRVIDTVAEREIGSVSIRLPGDLLDSRLDESTGRMYLLVGEPARRVGDTLMRGPRLSLVMLDPESGRQRNIRLMDERRKPHDELFHSPGTNRLAFDPRRSEVYVLSPWDASIQVYRDNGR